MTRVGRSFALLHALQGRPTVRLFRERALNQWLPADELRNQQLQRLQALLRHVELNVPHYRAQLQHSGVRAADITTLEVFGAKVPLLSRAVIKANLASLHAENRHRRLILHNTGGSSGQPLALPRDADSIATTWADYLLVRSWWGFSIGSPMAKIWGHWHGPQNRWRELLFEAKEAIKRQALKTVFLSAYNMTPATMSQFAKRIQRSRPLMLYGYASALETLAHYLEENSIDLRLPAEAFVVPTSEPLFPTTRALLRRVYGRPVANEYGACEVGLIAFECPGGGMHVMHDSLYLETVDTEGRPVPRGTPGEVVVTALGNYDVPLVRYRLGDVAVLSYGVCPCGREGDRLESIHGRQWAMLRGPSGKVVYPQIITQVVMTYLPATRRFQAVQERLDQVTIQVECSAEPSADSVGELSRALREELGESVQISVRRVDAIKAEKSGKYAVVKSMLPRDDAGVSAVSKTT